MVEDSWYNLLSLPVLRLHLYCVKSKSIPQDGFCHFRMFLITQMSIQVFYLFIFLFNYILI